MTLQADWTPYEPDARCPWSARLAAHLLRRAGFGPDRTSLDRALADGPRKTIDHLLRPPEETDKFNATFDAYDSASATGGSTESLRAWWLRRMIETPHPLLEKTTLLWHGHFAIGNRSVNNAALMTRCVHTLRRGALGSYRSLAAAVMKDPALYLSLRSERSRRTQPAPNAARQLLAVFGVGPGSFDEHDVTEAARALTGRAVMRNELRFFEHHYDDGEKTLLGRRGNWSGDDAVRIVLEHPATAKQIVRKLYAWLIAEDDAPEPALLAPLAGHLHEHDDLEAIIEIMLRSNRFFSAAAYRRRIKEPVELAVGLARAMEQTLPTLRLGQQLADLGQDLYQPPTSAGFPAGRDWIDQASLIGRWNLAAEMLAASGPYEGRLNPAALAAKHGQDQPDQAAGLLADLLLDGDLPAEIAQAWQQQPPKPAELPARLRELAITLTHQPEYQLA